MKNIVKSLALGLSLVALSVLPGCLGGKYASQSFCAVRYTLKVNREITDNKWINEILFIFPGGIVHGLAAFGDVIIFNSFEFWTGENPIKEITMVDDQGAEYMVSKTGETLKIVRTESNDEVNFVYNADDQAIYVLDEQGLSHKFAEVR